MAVMKSVTESVLIAMFFSLLLVNPPVFTTTGRDGVFEKDFFYLHAVTESVIYYNLLLY